MSTQPLDEYLVTLKRRETEIHAINKQDMVLRDFISNFEESRGQIRKVFRDHDDDHNNLLSAKEFLMAMTTGNFNLELEEAEEIVKYFFGNSIDTYHDTDEMKFSDFAKKVQGKKME